MSDGQVRMEEVPWARPNSGFTLLFEAYTMRLIESEIPMSSVAKHTRVAAPTSGVRFITGSPRPEQA